MRTKALLIFFDILICALLLTSCFKEETDCHYFQMDQKVMLNNKWKVDSMFVYLKDTLAHLMVDTQYVNDGECYFTMEDPDNCDKVGTMVYTRANGQQYTIGFHFSADYGIIMMDLQYPTSLDGLNSGFERRARVLFGDNSIQIGTYNYNPDYDNPKRHWWFNLSLKK